MYNLGRTFDGLNDAPPVDSTKIHPVPPLTAQVATNTLTQQANHLLANHQRLQSNVNEALMKSIRDDKSGGESGLVVLSAGTGPKAHMITAAINSNADSCVLSRRGSFSNMHGIGRGSSNVSQLELVSQPQTPYVIRSRMGSISPGDVVATPSLKVTASRLTRGSSRLSDKSTSKLSLHIMVVDDAPSNRKMLCRAIKAVESSGVCTISISEGSSGEDAVEMVSKASSTRKRPDSQISDRVHNFDSNIPTPIGGSSVVALPSVAGGVSAVATDCQGSTVVSALGTLTPIETVYYDMIFMDSEMPIMNGKEAIEIIRQKLHYQGLIYSVTGNDNRAQLQELRDAGATSVYLKPMKVAHVAELIKGIYYLL